MIVKTRIEIILRVAISNDYTASKMHKWGMLWGVKI